MLKDYSTARVVYNVSGAVLKLLARGEISQDVAKEIMSACRPYPQQDAGHSNELPKVRKPTDGKPLNPGDIVLCEDKARADKGADDCRVVIPYEDRFFNLLVLGPDGCGKTSQVMLPMCCQDVRNLEAGITVLEPKDDLTRQVAMMAKDAGRDYIYFDPTVDDCPFFNPLAGDEADVIESVVAAFLMLSPDSPRFFKDLSEELIGNAIKVLKRLDKAEGVDGKYSTFIWMSRILQNSGGQGRELVRRFSLLTTDDAEELKENQDIASWFLNEYYAERSKVYENTSGVRSKVSQLVENRYLSKVLNPDFEQGDCNQIDFDKHLADGGVVCISTAQYRLRETSRLLGYLFVLRLQKAVSKRAKSEGCHRAHFLYIDEFNAFATPGFASMLAQGRASRVASHLAIQAGAHLERGGKEGLKDRIFSNTHNLVIFPGTGSNDAISFAKEFGGGEESASGFSPVNIIYRPSGEVTYRVCHNGATQKPGVGKVSWLDDKYTAWIGRMVKEQIEPHEMRRGR